MSPPSRGAWIEMPGDGLRVQLAPSPPSRGAWIEIPTTVEITCRDLLVAPLAGGVD